jgi:hypothetical protein
MAAPVMDIAGVQLPAFRDAFTIPEMSSPDEGSYYAHDPVAAAPHEGPPMYQELEFSFPGVPGIGIKRMGFRGRQISCTAIFVGLTKASCENAKNMAFATWTPLASFPVTIPGGTQRPACRLVPGSGSGQGWLYMGGKMLLLVPLEFRQLRLS